MDAKNFSGRGKISALTLNRLYKLMLDSYGRRGWWPLMDAETLESRYSGKDDLSRDEQFEIALGAILTQNVAWKNVEKALVILKTDGILHPETLHPLEHDFIAERIRSTGYYNQKTIKIKRFLDWFASEGYSFDRLKAMEVKDARDILLSIKGVGPETADSMLLYSLLKKTFVVDAYTKRILAHLGIMPEGAGYDEVQRLFHEKFEGTVEDYRQYHALFVEHAKVHCTKKPSCESCFLKKHCLTGGLC